MMNLQIELVNDRVIDTILVYALIFGLILGAGWILFQCVKSFLKLNGFKGKTEEVNEAYEEPPLTEIKVKLISKECFVKTYGVKYPVTKQEYYFIFETNDKKILRYKVEESEYHSFDENQKGTIAIVNDNYYGFCVDE